MDKKVNKFSYTLLMRIIPFVFGMIIWTGFKNDIINYFNPNIPSYWFNWFSIPLNFAIVFVVISALYGIVIYKQSNKPKKIVSLIWYYAKLALFPLYLIIVTTEMVVKVLTGLFTITKKVWKFISTPYVIILLIALSILMWYFLHSLLIEEVVVVSVVLLVILSISKIVWLYIWIFFPLKILDTFDKLLDYYISIGLGPYYDTSKFLFKEDMTKHIIDKKKKEYNNAVDDEIKKVTNFITLLNKFNISSFVLNAFIILIIIIGTFICLDFAFSYFGINAIYQESFKSAVNLTFMDYVILSFRTLFFNDYARLAPMTQFSLSLIFIESLCGVFVFVLIIMSFSVITAQKGKRSLEKLIQMIQTRIDKLADSKVDNAD